MLYRCCIKLRADSLQYFNAVHTVISEDTDFDKAMCIEIDIDFFEDRISQTCITDHNDRMQAVSL